VNVATTLDYSTPLRSPHLLDGFFNYRNIRGEQNLAVILDVRSVEFVSGNTKIVEAGWAVVPLFQNKDQKLYIKSGIFQVPLLRGPPDDDLIKEMSTYEDQWNFIQNMISERKLSLAEPFSVIVRILDGQREGHFAKKYDYTRFDYSYMPAETKNKNYLFSELSLSKFSKMPKLSKVVPKTIDGSLFQKKITDDFVEKFGLLQFNTDEEQ